MKHYVVFVGRVPGIYETWAECEAQVKMFSGAIHKSYPNRQQAVLEFGKFGKNGGQRGKPEIKYSKPQKGICSDAAYSVKTKMLQWRVVDLCNGAVLHSAELKSEALYLTNIGEFFGLVRAVKYCHDAGLDYPIYSDSTTAIRWVSDRTVSTSVKDQTVLAMIEAGVAFLESIGRPNVFKWQTKLWGEIPADYGNKKRFSKTKYRALHRTGE